MDEKHERDLREKIDAAIAEVTAAEEALGSLLGELRAGVRAEKVTVTVAVQEAFERLRKARAFLAGLRDVVET